ncbi:TPA: hypothetical protein ACRUWO_004806, partial [Escherichia coli]
NRTLFNPRRILERSSWGLEVNFQPKRTIIFDIQTDPYKGFPEQSTPVFMVSVCSSVKIKGRDCGTINGHDESSSIRALMKDAREVLVR